MTAERYNRYILPFLIMLPILLYSIYKSDKTMINDTLAKANKSYAQAITSLENRQEHVKDGLAVIKNYKYITKDDSLNLAWTETDKLNELEKKLKELK